MLNLLETLWERCSTSWMVLIRWSPGLMIYSISPNGTKRNKRCSSPDLQSLHPRHMIIPIQSTIGIRNFMDTQSSMISISITNLTLASYQEIQKRIHMCGDDCWIFCYLFSWILPHLKVHNIFMVCSSPTLVNFHQKRTIDLSVIRFFAQKNLCTIWYIFYVWLLKNMCAPLLFLYIHTM